MVQTGHDNWDGGIDFYALMLQVPVRLYAEVEERRERLEESILKRIQQLTRGNGGVSVTEVVVSPVLVDRIRPPAPSDLSEQFREPSEHSSEVPSYWQAGHFRLFISHPSSKRESAHRLKEALSIYQVAAFVAHDDIEPAKEWQAEIETALRTMDALVALVSPDFIESKWCDQEIGIAIGRNKLVVPLRVGADPYGFLGKYQGIQTKGSNATTIAQQVIETLIKNDSTAFRLIDSLIERLARSNSYSSAKKTMSLINKTKRVSTAQAGKLLSALENNSEVSDASGVPEQIRALIARGSAEETA